MKISGDLENNAASAVARFMAASARTAPKTRGIDNIVMIAIDSAGDRARLIKKMREISRREDRPSFERDANSIDASPVIMVIGVMSNPSGLNCGFCGYAACEGLKKKGGVCAYNSIDLGIAVNSAVATANQFHVDNRIMYSIGRASLDLKLFDKDVKQALGIPLSVTGKNPFFDRQ